MALSIHPMDAALGAEIRGVDLSQTLDDETFGRIEDAFNAYSVLLFRGQSLAADRQVAFSRRFGDLEVHVLDQYNHPDYPEILVVSNIMDGDRHVGIYDAGKYWHTDLSYMDVPSRGSMLHAIEVPLENGAPRGDTLFASTTAAYDALSEDVKRRIEGLEAVYSLGHRFSRIVADGDTGAGMTEDQKAMAPEVVHRVVQTHPVTGRRVLYVNEGQTARILDVPAAESRALLETLFAHVKRPEFVYRHTWRVGDVVMWDNIPTQHLAVQDYALPQRRYMHRTTLRGSPIA
jgi:taurine dioxygenase